MAHIIYPWENIILQNVAYLSYSTTHAALSALAHTPPAHSGTIKLASKRQHLQKLLGRLEFQLSAADELEIRLRDYHSSSTWRAGQRCSNRLIRPDSRPQSAKRVAAAAAAEEVCQSIVTQHRMRDFRHVDALLFNSSLLRWPMSLPKLQRSPVKRKVSSSLGESNQPISHTLILVSIHQSEEQDYSFMSALQAT